MGLSGYEPFACQSLDVIMGASHGHAEPVADLLEGRRSPLKALLAYDEIQDAFLFGP